MDRSFLSDPAVVGASRAFVCVRLLSYESKDEAAFLKSFGATKSGEAENTVFCILAPDGKRKLTRAARGPRQLFADADAMARGMAKIASDFPADKVSTKRPAVPLVDNVRLALNVAACDRQPLVVIHATDEAVGKKLLAGISELAWSDELIGKFVYVRSESRKELDAFKGTAIGPAVFVVAPDTFGAGGKVLYQLDGDPASTKLAELLKTGLARFQRGERNFWQHVQTGHQQGVFWQTLTPVTDPMELRAREKNRKKSPQD